MTIRSTTRGFLALALLGTTPLLVGCEEKGPAQKAGQSVDKAAQDVKDTISPPGPVEKAGRAVDNAAK